MHKLISILLLILLSGVTIFGQGQDQRRAAISPNIIAVNSGLNSFSNAVYTANLLSTPENPQIVYIPPGKYTNIGRVSLNANVSVTGAGMDISYLYGNTLAPGAATMIQASNDCTISDLTLILLDASGYFANFGGQSENPSSYSNITVSSVHMVAPQANVIFNDNDSSPTYVKYNNCVFESYLLNVDFGPDIQSGQTNKQELSNCSFLVDPVVNTVSSVFNVYLRGDASLIGVNARFISCAFKAKDGTNLVAGLNTDIADPTLPPYAYFGNCTWDLSQTNFVAGGHGLLGMTNHGAVIEFEGTSPTNSLIDNGTGRYIFKSRNSPASSVTAVATAANTLETDLMTYTLLAGTLCFTNQNLELTAWGSFGATANSKDIRVKMGGVTLLDTLPRANNAQEWLLSGTISYKDVSTLKSAFRFEVTGFITNDILAPTLKANTNIVLRITGSNHVAAASDIILEGWKLKWVP